MNEHDLRELRERVLDGDRPVVVDEEWWCVACGLRTRDDRLFAAHLRRHLAEPEAL